MAIRRRPAMGLVRHVRFMQHVIHSAASASARRLHGGHCGPLCAFTRAVSSGTGVAWQRHRPVQHTVHHGDAVSAAEEE